MNFKKANRSIHKWASIIIALPLLVVLISGILLLLKKEISFIQPPTARGESPVPSLHFDQVLAIAQSVSTAKIQSWDDIDRLDIRPSKGLIKIRSYNRVEIQIDSSSGEILHIAKRRSDLIESIHDGTFFHKKANLWLMLPSAVAALLILVTGVVLFFIPYIIKNRKNRKIIPQLIRE